MKIPDLKEIAVSWFRAANPTEEQKARAEHRLSVCDSCPAKEFSNLTKTYKCGECGCYLNKKVFTPKGKDACPLGKWDE